MYVSIFLHACEQHRLLSEELYKYYYCSRYFCLHTCLYVECTVVKEAAKLSDDVTKLGSDTTDLILASDTQKPMDLSPTRVCLTVKLIIKDIRSLIKILHWHCSITGTHTTMYATSNSNITPYRINGMNISLFRIIILYCFNFVETKA